jgi:hypothetical protein
MKKGLAAGVLALMLAAPTAAWAVRTSAHPHDDERRGQPASDVTRPDGRSTRGGLPVQPEGGRGGISGDFDVQPQGGRGGISGDFDVQPQGGRSGIGGDV